MKLTDIIKSILKNEKIPNIQYSYNFEENTYVYFNNELLMRLNFNDEESMVICSGFNYISYSSNIVSRELLTYSTTVATAINFSLGEDFNEQFFLYTLDNSIGSYANDIVFLRDAYVSIKNDPDIEKVQILFAKPNISQQGFTI